MQLAAQGVHYPSLRPGHWKEMPAHHKVAQAVARRSIVDRIRLARYRRWLAESRSWARVTVLSAEPVYRHIVGDVTPGGMTAWLAAHRAYLARLGEWLAGFEVQPVVYFRQPDELAVSLYKEHVVRRLLPARERSLEAFLAFTAHYYQYSSHVDALRDVLGAVTVRDYAEAARAGLHADFAALVGATSLPSPARTAVRRSPGNRAILWLARGSQGHTRRDHYRRVLFALRMGNEVPFAEPGPTTLWPNRAAFGHFVERHQSSWDLPFIRLPTARDVPPATWTEGDQAAADQAFLVWETQNLQLLRHRESLGLAFYAPDPG